MPRTIQLHPLSLLAGVGIALLGLVAMGQTSVPNRPLLDHSSMFSQVAHPRDWVVIKEGTTYTVPVGKLLVITALGDHLGSCGATYLNFNGVRVLTSLSVECSAAYTEGTVFMEEVPIGLRASSGDVVTLTHQVSPGVARAWGYLVDA
jgi:hypothetical protein